MTAKRTRKRTTTKDSGNDKPPELPAVVSPRGGLLEPVASDEELVAGFKRFVELKDKLLEEHDYTWFVAYKVGSKLEKKGFDTKKDAEDLRKVLGGKRIQSSLEKKMKKSGCRKLDKAFGISHEVLEYERDANFVRYLVVAKAGNGQSSPQSGSCSRDERGKSNAPLHRIDGTALTRAKNRATMDLLGGETTAEEFEDYLDQGEAPPPPAAKPPNPAVPTYQPPHAPAAPSKPKTSEEMRAEVDKKFAGQKAAKPVDTVQLRGRLFAALKATGLDEKIAKIKLKKTMKERYGTESTKDLTEAQLLELTAKIEKSTKK